MVGRKLAISAPSIRFAEGENTARRSGVENPLAGLRQLVTRAVVRISGYQEKENIRVPSSYMSTGRSPYFLTGILPPFAHSEGYWIAQNAGSSALSEKKFIVEGMK